MKKINLWAIAGTVTFGTLMLLYGKVFNVLYNAGVLKTEATLLMAIFWMILPMIMTGIKAVKYSMKIIEWDNKIENLKEWKEAIGA